MNLNPITWPGGNLDPFRVNHNGKIITSGKRQQGCDPLCAHDALKFWNRGAARSLSRDFTPDELAKINPLLAPERKPIALVDLIDTSPELWFETNLQSSGFVMRPARKTKVRWFYLDRSTKPLYPEKPKVGLMPAEWITLAGNPQFDWYGLRLEGRFDSLVHGPSLLAHLS